MKNYYITKNNEKIEIIDEKRIDLSYKNIKEIHITSLIKCEKLYLESNFLTEFNINLPSCKIANSCNFATNCKELDLSYNNLTRFKTDLPNCKYLDLEYNNLKSFNANLPNIEYLYLTNNDLTYKQFNNNITFYI